MPGRQDGSVPYNHPESAAPLVDERQAWKASYEADPTRCPKCLSRSVGDTPEYDGEGVVCWTCGWSLETSARFQQGDAPTGQAYPAQKDRQTYRRKAQKMTREKMCANGKHVLPTVITGDDWRCGRCVHAGNNARWKREKQQSRVPV